MSDEYSYTIKIPKERIAVLIGTKGTNKKRLEQFGSCKLDIDSDEGDITVIGSDALNLFTVREIIRAIGRGFNPDIALLLEKQDYGLEVLSLGAKSKNDAERLRGRIIGEEGKARRVIEDLTGAYLSVYGKTVSVIGEFEALRHARKAIEMLLDGAAHATVYRMLEKKRRLIRQPF